MHPTGQKVAKDIEHAFYLYYRPLNLYALHYLNDIDRVEDIVQECFVCLWELLRKGEEIADIRSYLYRMVRNRCVDACRAEEKAGSRIPPEELAETLPEDEYEERSFIEARLWTAIDSLPARCREAFLMHKQQGMSYQEIADRLGISVHTVENQIRKALKVLRGKAKMIYYFFFG